MDRDSMVRDTAPVRAGEQLELTALEAYLRERATQLRLDVEAETGDAEIRLEQFPGGHSNLTYLVRFGQQEFVLRRPPIGPVAPTAHDMPREYKLLTLLHPVFPLAPKPLLLCEDNSIIGAPFYLMERANGLIIRHRVPAEIGEDHILRQRISEAVVDTLVALHDVDIHASGIVQIGKPAGFVERQVRGWSERWQRSKTNELPQMESVIKWLVEHLPSETSSEAVSATLVHNDYKLDNVMLDRADPARIVAVLDWEMCTVGDPLVDLGLFLCYWTLKDEDEEMPQDSLVSITTAPGWMKRARIIERYASMSGRDLSGLAFYETFAHFKVAIILQQIYFRYVRGQTRDERFKNFDRRVRSLAQAASRLAESSAS
jgi:aminoglycoside phosphotransferase (APT) family kinase protein